MVRDALGRAVLAGTVEGLELMVDLTGEASGPYILHVAIAGAGTIRRAVLIRGENVIATDMRSSRDDP
ncbi:MAG: hypothetical protein IPN62_17695 [Flavobacteriales bacterium]|nr:hypothetical protein [Flavobacteriales bacterium]